jgi:hypothetical protein
MKIHPLKLAVAQYLSELKTTDYEFMIEQIHNNLYRRVLKCPTREMFLGLTNSWKNRTPEEVLPYLKEVIIEALEYNGIEQTFVDKDWDNLAIIRTPHESNRWGEIRKWETVELNTTKNYVSEFFEL